MLGDPLIRISEHHPDGVRRILLWSALGCSLVHEHGRWRLERPATMTGMRGPSPRTIQDRIAQAAIAAGARVSTPASLFDVLETARAA